MMCSKLLPNTLQAHALPDANKRTGLAVALEYLSLNEYELTADNDLLADAVRDLVLGSITETDFADVLYAQYVKGAHDSPS